MEQHPITPEVAEFVKWMHVQHYWYLTTANGWLHGTHFEIGHLTTAELFDWWKLNVKK